MRQTALDWLGRSYGCAALPLHDANCTNGALRQMGSAIDNPLTLAMIH